MSKLMQIAYALPPAGDWSIDTCGSTVAFSGRASRLAPTVRARFTGVHGALHLAADPNRSRVDVSLDLRTVTTGNPAWDDLLRAADPFRAREQPIARYRSSRVSWDGTGFRVTGALELAGRRLDLPLTARMAARDRAVRLEATGVVDPRAAGIRLSLPGASLLVPRSLSLAISVLATSATSAADPGKTRALALAG